MVDQAHALIPEARVGFVGVARNEETHQPTPYLESLPDDLSTQPVMVLDPMLATGGSMAHTIELLHARDAVDITAVCVVVAPEGIAALEKVAPNMRLFTAAIDDGLNDIAYIVPGLGDAGDRQFGPRCLADAVTVRLRDPTSAVVPPADGASRTPAATIASCRLADVGHSPRSESRCST